MDLSLEFDIPKTPLLQKGAAGKVVHDELLQAMEVGVNLMHGAVVPLVPVDRGTLRNGVQNEIQGQAVDLTGRVFNPLLHALPVETGAKPHWPPAAALEGWVKRKLGISDPREAKSVAFLVARAIARRGTKAVEMFARGFTAAEPRVRARFDEALKRIAERLSQGGGGRGGGR